MHESSAVLTCHIIVLEEKRAVSYTARNHCTGISSVLELPKPKLCNPQAA